MNKKNVVGACVMAGVILLSIPLGAHMSMTKLREEAKDSYYYDKTGFAIYQGVEERQAAGSNLITVAERYTSQNPELTGLIGDLEYAVSLAESSYGDFFEEAQANRQIGEAAQALYDALGNVQLDEFDRDYPDQLMAQLESAQDQINRSSYNDDAREFNARLEKFPMNFLRHIAGVQPLATYNDETEE